MIFANRMTFMKIFPAKFFYTLIDLCVILSVRSIMSTLFNYFKQKDITPESLFPEPTRSLSKTIPSSCIEVVNSLVKQLVEKTSDGCSSVVKDKSKFMRGAYGKFSADEKAVIGKQAGEHGISATT